MLRWSVWGRRRSAGAGWSFVAAVALSLVWAPLGAAQDVPFDAIVVENEVIVRAGAGNAYYEVGRLERGASVRVEEVLYGWNRIEPPEGVYSFVSKMNVDARGDGRVGEVNTDRVDVTAANVAGPAQSYRRQLVLHEGDTVRIVGEVDSFYRVEPPPGAPVYLPPGSVRRADSEEALAIRRELEPMQSDQAAEQPGQPESPEQAAGEPADESADELAEGQADPSAGQAEDRDQSDQPQTAQGAQGDEAEDVAADVEAAQDEDSAAEVADAQLADAQIADADAVEGSPAGIEEALDGAPEDMAEADAAEVEAVETPAVTPELREIELRNIPLAMQPLEDQPLDQMIADYQRVLDEVSDMPPRDRRLARMRVATFEDNQRRAEVLSRIQSVRRASEQRQAELAADTREDAAEQQREPRSYDYEGRLLASAVYDGHTLPRLFRLVNTGSGRTIAYVEPDDAVEPHRMLGRRVGVRGQREYHDALGLYVFNVRYMDPLDGSQ